MIDPKVLYEQLLTENIDFFTGVPDSLLSNFSAYLQENASRHHITANEGNAVAMAAGSYFATGNPGFVYLQNSGQGNTVNPLVSLADPSVYGVPMIMLVGWRGEPGKKDEPQHLNQGAATCDLFDSINIPWYILPVDEKDMTVIISKAVALTKNEKKPVALIVQKGTFLEYKLKVVGENSPALSRENAIKTVASSLAKDNVIVATTGKISRELYAYRADNEMNGEGDFLTVGSMGHSSQIALAIAMEKPEKKIYCFDGDGAVLMHMGAMAIAGTSKVENFFHIVFNNAAHDSVGGLPTVGNKISFTTIAEGCGYSNVSKVTSAEEIKEVLSRDVKGPVFIEVVVSKGSREDLPRPKSTPSKRKESFMEFLRK